MNNEVDNLEKNVFRLLKRSDKNQLLSEKFTEHLVAKALAELAEQPVDNDRFLEHSILRK